MWDRGRPRRVSSAWTARSGSRAEEPDADLAQLAAQLGRFIFFAGGTTSRLQRIESALDWPRRLALPEIFSQALNTKAILSSPTSDARGPDAAPLRARSRSRERQAVRRAPGVLQPGGLASNADASRRRRRPGTGSHSPVALETATGVLFLAQAYPLFALGKWGEVLEWASALPEDWRNARQAYSTVGSIGVIVRVHTGRLDEARHWVELLDEFSTSSDAQERAAIAAGKGRLLLAQGDAGEALCFAQLAIDSAVDDGHRIRNM